MYDSRMTGHHSIFVDLDASHFAGHDRDAPLGQVEGGDRGVLHVQHPVAVAVRLAQPGHGGGRELPDHLPGREPGHFQAVGIGALLGHQEARTVGADLQEPVFGARPEGHLDGRAAEHVRHVGQPAHDDQETVGVAHGVVAVFDQSLHAEVVADQVAVDRQARSGQGPAAELVEAHLVVAEFERGGASLDGIEDRKQVVAEGSRLRVAGVGVAGHDRVGVLLGQVEHGFLHVVDLAHLPQQVEADEDRLPGGRRSPHDHQVASHLGAEPLAEPGLRLVEVGPSAGSLAVRRVQQFQHRAGDFRGVLGRHDPCLMSIVVQAAVISRRSPTSWTLLMRWINSFLAFAGAAGFLACPKQTPPRSSPRTNEPAT